LKLVNVKAGFVNMAKLSPGVLEALRNAGATEEMIACAQAKEREEHQAVVVKNRSRETERKRRHRATQRAARPAVTQVEPPSIAATVKVSLWDRLLSAANGNVAHSIEEAGPIADLLEQGCDLDLDILPIVSRMVPSLPRPLRTWGAPWLVREILAAREARLAGHPV
jgi:hypothetical protein